MHRYDPPVEERPLLQTGQHAAPSIRIHQVVKVVAQVTQHQNVPLHRVDLEQALDDIGPAREHGLLRLRQEMSVLRRILFSDRSPAGTTVLQDELVDDLNQPKLVELTVFVLDSRDPRLQTPPETRPLGGTQPRPP
jgi:hypothetical protein